MRRLVQGALAAHYAAKGELRSEFSRSILDEESLTIPHPHPPRPLPPPPPPAPQRGPPRARPRDAPLARDFVYPLFVTHGDDVRREIASMPGQYQLSLDQLAARSRGAARARHPRRPPLRPARTQRRRRLRGLRRRRHRPAGRARPQGRRPRPRRHHRRLPLRVHRPRPLRHRHAAPATSTTTRRWRSWPAPPSRHAEAGADIVAPCDMMDGLVAAIRAALDDAGFAHDADHGLRRQVRLGLLRPLPRRRRVRAPQFGDRRGYQMDPRQRPRGPARDRGRHRRRRRHRHGQAGAALPRRHRAAPATASTCPSPPTTSAANTPWSRPPPQNGWIDERRATLEILTGIKRAGADIIITYHAKEAARWLAR